MSSFHVPYDDHWPMAFAEEAARVQAVLGSAALRIDHVGSTSLVGMVGKPVIDIQVSVTSLEPLNTLIVRMNAAGYTHMLLPEPPVTEYPFFHRHARWPRAYHVHLCEAGGDQELRHLAFRDWLRHHPDDRRAYKALKAELACEVNPSNPWSLLSYSRRKGEFVKSIEKRARDQSEEARKRGESPE